MYPKDCCKIQPSDATTFQLIAIILCNLIIMSWPLALLETMNLTILHIISFHSFPCSCIDYCFFTTFSRCLNQDINIFKIRQNEN